MKLRALRAALVRSTFPESAGLADVITRMGFIQADPIRAPARAQDLILRHRVTDYRAGDLERHYPELDLDEDFVYAYGFVPARTRALLHPRGGEKPRGLAREILEFVARTGPTHPTDLVQHFGQRRASNAWGAQSRASTRVLHRLHYQGHLRIARRDGGVRVYEAANPVGDPLTPAERLDRLVILVADIFGPLPLSSLRGVMNHLKYAVPTARARHLAIPRLLAAGQLESGVVDGVSYVWSPAHAPLRDVEAPRLVRFLAPFDPLVWDRRRFEQLWEWSYRFEAYTPLAKRKLGYYALPLLWVDRVIGWTNVSVKSGRLTAELGYVKGRPRGREFTVALEAELARVRRFLALPALE